MSSVYPPGGVFLNHGGHLTSTLEPDLPTQIFAMLTSHHPKLMKAEVKLAQSGSTGIYCLPGRGGRLDQGLWLEIHRRGLSLAGRQTVGEFERLSFSDQVQIIADDLRSAFWHEEALVIANSYGSYLFLHAQSLIPSFPGRVLLLSPVVGGVTSPQTGVHFSPPCADRLLKLAEAGDFNAPRSCEIHVGELDWQCPPALVCKFAELVGIPVTVVPSDGHMLSKSYVSRLLDTWLP
ncbi:MAG: hypothetical protein ACK4IB_01185 [Erythrobacter sp.]